MPSSASYVAQLVVQLADSSSMIATGLTVQSSVAYERQDFTCTPAVRSCQQLQHCVGVSNKCVHSLSANVTRRQEDAGGQT